MIIDKKRFLKIASEQIRLSATWRDSKVGRYSFDGRNEEASRLLFALESQVELSDSAWEEIAPLVSDRVACLAAMSATNREVGFKKHPRDFAAWLYNFLSMLEDHQPVTA